MMKAKRKISFILSLILVLSFVMSVPVFAAESDLGPQKITGGKRDFRWPVPGNYGVSSCFYDGRGHYAIDIPANVGTPIVSAYDGIVEEVTYNGNNDHGFGNGVLVKHNYTTSNGQNLTLYTRYAHMELISVSAGQKVYRGVTQIGTVGGSGNGSPNYYGSHLDFQILTSTNWINWRTSSIDPFSNQLLELPSSVYCASTSECCGVGPTGCCCFYYLQNVKSLYANTSGDSTIEQKPIASWDYVSGDADSIIVRGWAYDPNTVGQSVTMHVYIDDMHVFTITADKERTDVHSAYGCGNYHGFEAIIPFKVASESNHNVSIYALNTTAGADATFLGTQTVTIKPRPKVTDVTVSDVSETGYTITCNVEAAGGINRVQFPTWTYYNGQDDLSDSWSTMSHYSGTISGNRVSYRVNASDHNGEKGLYYTHIYAYANDGTHTCVPVTANIGTNTLVPVKTAEYNGSRYEVYIVDDVISERTVWTYAKTFAESVGGHLATITSQGEQDAINAMVTTQAEGYWIGGTDEVSEGTWRWVTGEPFVYQNWAPNEPTNSFGMQNYLALWPSVGKWDDGLNDAETVDYGFIVEYDLQTHDHDYKQTGYTAATCTQNGVITYTCECGDTYTSEIISPGHQYTSEIIGATCLEYEKIVYTCSVCGDTYSVSSGEKTEWSTSKPVGVDESLIESKTQYRYSDYETKTSYEASLSGYTQLSSKWEQVNSGSVEYVKNWPSGFSTGSGLYSRFNQASVTASETATNKTVINSDNVTGYLYYHWCRGTYTTGPINRTTSPVYTSDYVCFHGFYSTTNPATLTSSSDGDGSYAYPNGDSCVDSHWYYVVPVYTQNYTTYKKLFTYGRWSNWSDWSDTAYTAADGRQVETRTLYRYANDELTGHTEVKDKAVAATCTTAGKTEGKHCSVCNKVLVAQETIKALGHTEVKDKAVAATCTTAGKTEGKHCSVCNKVLVAQETIKALGHTEVKDKAVAATCTTAGKTEGKHCSVCNKVLVAQETIKALGHTEVKDKAVAATCTTAGKTEGKHCSVCNKVLVAQETIKALGHSWKVESTANGIITYVCTTCGEKKEEKDPNAQKPQFEDVKADAYYADAVQWAVANGITNGYGSETTFCPDIECTRGQVVTFLWRAAGSPESVSLINPFTDVAKDAYYYKAVLWAVENGITAGYGSDTIFNPDGVCNRAQVATFMWRSAGKPGMSGVNNRFTDVARDAYYYDAVLWAVENGITNGYGSDTIFNPDGNCTRGQIVTFLYRGIK